MIDLIQNTNLVTLVITAYNKPEYTKKTLESIVSQSYRPIEIIFIDDNSPQTLEPFFNNFFREIKDEEIIPKFFRNSKNLGPYYNLLSGFKKINGKYLVIMNHDDWFTDTDFLKKAITHMDNVSNCFMVVMNSKIEGHELTMFNHKFSSDPILLDGKKYLNKYLFKKIHPAYSGVVLNFNKLRNLNYEQVFISKEEAQTLEIIPDESFITLSLLAERGSVLVSNQIVSIRGNPRDSYSKTAEWRKIWVLSVFFPFYKLLIYFIRMKRWRGAIGIFRAIVRLRRVKGSQIMYYLRKDGFHFYTLLFLINTFYSTIIYYLENPRRIIVSILPDLIYKRLVKFRNKS